MADAHGSAKEVRYKKEGSGWGVPPGETGAQLLRRVTYTPNLKKSISEGDEITRHRQRTNVRHGVRSVDASFAGKLSAGTFKDFFAAAVRKAYAAVAALTGLNITVAGAGPTYTITRDSGSWLTGGIKFGQVGRLTAGSFNAANLNKNLAVIALTATVLTVIPLNGVAMVAEGPIGSATWTPTGKVTFAQPSGHTDDSFAFEDWHSDAGMSELYLGQKVSELGIAVPEDGNVDISMSFLGKDVQTGTVEYYTTPTVETSTPICHSSSGIIVANGGELAIVTGMSVSIKVSQAGQPAVGKRVYRGINAGKIMVDGQLSAYMPDGQLRDYFLNEESVSLIGVFGGAETAAADFVGLTLPKTKFTSADKDDGDKSHVRTFSFVSEYNFAGGSGQDQEQTSIYVQDSGA